MAKINYNTPEFAEAVKNSKSCSELLRTIGLRPVGGNFATIKKWVSKLDLDISNWTDGRKWNKGLKLKDWKDYSGVNSLKKHLIKHLGHKCEKCLTSVWYDTPIMLEIHHMDGDRTNNDLKNLQLLCPNCHAMTDNWRGKKNAPGQIPTDTLRILSPLPLAVGLRERKPKKEKAIKQKKDKNIPLTKAHWPDIETLKQMISTMSVRSIANKLGVSDNAVRHHVKKRGINISDISMWSKKHGTRSSDWRKT